MNKQHELDARNLFCPLPIIRAQIKVKRCQAGDLLVIHATDPGVKDDFPAWCRIHGHELLNIQEKNNEIIITIRVCKI